MAALTLAACTQAGEGGGTPPSASPMPEKVMSAADAAACESSGGGVDVRGRLQAEMCVHPFADAGKQCSDSSQCEGKCIASASAAEGESDTAAGSCQADDRLFGCYAELEDGQRVRAICVD